MIFLLNSHNRNDFGNTEDTIENYSYNLAFPIKNVSKMQLLQAIVPKSIYPVIANYNDTLTLDIASNPYTLTFTAQNYTGAQLAAEFQAKARAAASITDFDVTYDVQTNKLSITTAAVSYNIDDQGGLSAILGVRHYNLVSAGGETKELPYQVDLSFPRYLLLDIVLSDSYNSQVYDAFNTYSFVVPISGSNFIEISNYYQGTFYQQIDKTSDVSIRVIQVRWSLPDGNKLSGFFNGVDNQLIIQTDGEF